MLVSPSYYHWILPTHHTSRDKLESYAKTGLYPTVDEILFPALWYCFLFGVARQVFTYAVFQVCFIDFHIRWKKKMGIFLKNSC